MYIKGVYYDQKNIRKYTGCTRKNHQILKTIFYHKLAMDIQACGKILNLKKARVGMHLVTYFKTFMHFGPMDLSLQNSIWACQIGEIPHKQVSLNETLTL